MTTRVPNGRARVKGFGLNTIDSTGDAFVNKNSIRVRLPEFGGYSVHFTLSGRNGHNFASGCRIVWNHPDTTLERP